MGRNIRAFDLGGISMALNGSQEATRSHRRQEVARLRLRGLTIREIEDELPRIGVINREGNKPWARGTICGDLKVLDTEWRAEAQDDIAKWKALSLARIERALQAAWAADRIDYVLRAIEDERKLLGLDAPAKAEHSGPGGGPIKTEVAQVVVYIPDNERDNRDTPTEGAAGSVSEDAG